MKQNDKKTKMVNTMWVREDDRPIAAPPGTRR